MFGGRLTLPSFITLMLLPLFCLVVIFILLLFIIVLIDMRVHVQTFTAVVCLRNLLHFCKQAKNLNQFF